LDVSASSTSFAQEEILWTLMVPGAQPPAAQAQGRTPMEHRESL
jgi:hypothetical protein